MEEIDYQKVGLRVGLEIHQQLKSSRKLFCHCKPQLLTEKPDVIVMRWMRPTLGETGEIDPTMLKEFKKRKIIVYEAYSKHTCLYEIDEVPPYDVDEESLKTAILIAKLFHMKIPDVVIVSRKQYLDGSVPSGFQRTMIIGLDGWMPLSNGKKLRIVQLCLEEDAARKISEDDKKIVYRVDRLGIPLVEITTAADLHSPEEVLDAALRIGSLLRATGKAMRGIGTIRQDINVSIKGGNRIEIKGVQYPEWFKPLIDNEIRRQLKLIEIAKELQKRGVTEEDIEKEKPVDVSEIFKKTKARFIKSALSRGEKVIAIRLPGFGGLLGIEILPGRRFGKEFAERVKVIVGLAGIIHTDELPAYGISEEEKEELFKATGADKTKDAVAFVVGPEDRALDAIDEIKERAKQAIKGVPPETRRANPDGTTSFERPLGTAARLYPDTDTPPIILTQEFIKEATAYLPPYPWEKEKEYMEKFGFTANEARRIVLSDRFELFEKAVSIGIPAKFVYSVIFNLMTSLRRDGFNVDQISDEKLLKLFKYFKDEKISKEAFEPMLKYLSSHPDKNIDEAIEALGLKKISIDEVKKFLDELVERNVKLIAERGERAIKGLMGDAMRVLRGKVDGKIVYNLLLERIKRKIAELKSKT